MRTRDPVAMTAWSKSVTNRSSTQVDVKVVGTGEMAVAIDLSDVVLAHQKMHAANRASATSRLRDTARE